MREKALLEYAGDIPESPKINRKQIEAAKQARLAKLDEMKKLYFNAGRWAGGARDFTARQAYEQVAGRVKDAAS